MEEDDGGLGGVLLSELGGIWIDVWAAEGRVLQTQSLAGFREHCVLILVLVQGPDDTWVLSMPYPSSTRVPVVSSDDTGVVVDAIIRGGEKYYGKTVTVVGDLMPEEDRLRIWAKGIRYLFSLCRSMADSIQLWV
jgi:hypothetical protein